MKLSIGRDPENDIVIWDATNQVSRLHAELYLKPNGEIIIIDKSSNGTFINGARIPKEKPFLVVRNTNINFAGVAFLDWSKIPTPHNRSRSNTGGTTDFGRDLRQVVDELTDSSQISKYIIACVKFFKLNGSETIVSWAKDPKSSPIDPKLFFIWGVGMAIFCFVFIIKKIFEDNSFLNDLDFFAEIVLAILLVISTFSAGYVLYKIFKFFLNSKKRWESYKRLYLLCMGFGFMSFTICTLPLIPSLMAGSINSSFETILLCLFIGSLASLSIRFFILIISAHQKFWNIHFGMVLLVFFIVGGIISSMFYFLIKCSDL